MGIYSRYIQDERRRAYIPVSRVMLAEKTEHAEKLPGNTLVQARFNNPDLIILNPGGCLLLDFGFEFHGGIRIVSAGKAGRVDLTFGESVSEAAGVPDQDHAIHKTELQVPKMGMLEYGNTAFRFVRISNCGSEVLELHNVIGVSLHRELEEKGSFTSSDERLNKIWETARHTLHLNMQDYIYDGPKRDRLVWMGDLHPEIRGILNAYGAVDLIPASLDFVADDTPGVTPMNTIPSYNCWFVINVWEYYRFTGEVSYVQKHADYLENLLKHYAGFVGADGVEKMPEMRFLDWPTLSDPVALHAGLQGLLCWMMQCGADLLATVGRENAFALEAAGKLKTHVPDCGSRKAAAALLTLTGIADRRDVLLKDPLTDVSTFYGFYVLLAQPTEPALHLIRNYWGAMLDRGATTFWEDFDMAWLENSGRIDEFTPPGKKDLHADYGNYCYKGLRHSLAHGWASGPLSFLSERISGVKILEPGGKKIAVTPELGDLEYARVEVPTCWGNVCVEQEKGKQPEITVPAEITVIQ